MPVSDGFVCEHCAAEVPALYGENRNSCTMCGWSKHVEFGTTFRPPCEGMMKPTPAGEHEAVWRCTRCGFMMRGPTEEATDLLCAGELPFVEVRIFTDLGEEAYQVERRGRVVLCENPFRRTYEESLLWHQAWESAHPDS